MRDLSKGGKIQIVAEEVAACRETVFLTFEAKDLDNKDFFSKSDPFLEISRANENGEFSLVHRGVQYIETIIKSQFIYRRF